MCWYLFFNLIFFMIIVYSLILVNFRCSEIGVFGKMEWNTNWHWLVARKLWILEQLARLCHPTLGGVNSMAMARTLKFIPILSLWASFIAYKITQRPFVLCSHGLRLCLGLSPSQFSLPFNLSVCYRCLHFWVSKLPPAHGFLCCIVLSPLYLCV